MMIQGVSLNEMLSQSITVITKPSVQSFEEFEKRGGTREALIYVGVAAAAAGIVSLLFGLLGGIVAALAGFLIAFLSPLIGFVVFAFLLYFIAKQQGGTGTQDEVFYTTALYAAPLQAVTGIVGAIPLINCVFAPVSLALAIYQAYLAYLAVRASMNIDQNKGIITVVVAIIAQLLITFLIGGVFGALLISASAATGTLGS